MPAKHLKRITTYVDPEVYEIIAHRAQEENRTISNMAATMLAQAAYTGTGKHPVEPEQKPQQEGAS
ncbi:ribbon-helix-helix domain-containing protein [Microseira wollei]|uniref:CopG-like ribbon-helix-helix domain-containing protein n=1 Tax=Microseira wollei NIES-4236 TaxID=2530354 RepID=A0AAV3XQQ4_9CYAN|nr:hypothetical protein [Microseira wollei]GET42892.1 hypothetical protein MiSe_77100 [Microseira wollei NIES-4236]